MKKVLLSLGLLIGVNSMFAQSMLDSVFVEKHTLTVDELTLTGAPEGSVTYRVFVDMKPGKKLVMVGGNANHALTFSTTTSFYNDGDGITVGNNEKPFNATSHTVANENNLSKFSTYITLGGISKKTGSGVTLTNARVGVPISEVPTGYIDGTAASVGFIGIDANTVDAGLNGGSILTTTNGYYFILGGTTGSAGTNSILIGQFTTEGEFSYEFLLQLTDGTLSEKYVAGGPAATLTGNPSGEYINSTLSGSSPYVKTWDGSSWSPSAPTAFNKAIINGNYNDIGFSCKDLVINAGKQVTITSGTLAVKGNVLLKSDVTGTASFIDNGTVTVAGTTSVEQYLKTQRNWYLSSPVSTAKSSAILPAINAASQLWNYNEKTPTWNEITDQNTSLNKMVGYTAYIWGQTADTTIIFTGGTLNTGTQTISTLSRTGSTDAKRGFNLIGNPYPSSIDLSKATITNIDSTIWYRTQNNSNVYVFDTYNILSGVGTNNNQNGVVTKYVAPMQAVWVHVKADGLTGTVSLNNSTRTHQSAGLKSDIEINNIRLKVSNGKNSDETIIVFNENANNGFDGYDSQKMFNDSSDVPEIYTTVGDEKVVINGMKPIDSTKVIKVGFKTAKSGKYTISASEISGLGGKSVILEDKILHKTQDLTKVPAYTFTTESSVNDTNRFVIRLKSDATTTESTLAEANDITVFTNGTGIVVKTSIDNTSGSIIVFDILGREIANAVLTGTQTIIEKPAISGAYFVKVNTDKKVDTKKIIVE